MTAAQKRAVLDLIGQGYDVDVLFLDGHNDSAIVSVCDREVRLDAALSITRGGSVRWPSPASPGR